MEPPPLESREAAALKKVRDHLHLLGTLYILFGLMALPGLLIIGMQHSLMAELLGIVQASYSIGSDLDLQVLFHLLTWGAVTLIIVHVISFIWIGICFRKQDRWVACIIAALFCCMSVPLGTLLGVFSLINLNSPEGRKLFGRE